MSEESYKIQTVLEEYLITLEEKGGKLTFYSIQGNKTPKIVKPFSKESVEPPKLSKQKSTKSLFVLDKTTFLTSFEFHFVLQQLNDDKISESQGYYKVKGGRIRKIIKGHNSQEVYVLLEYYQEWSVLRINFDTGKEDKYDLPIGSKVDIEDFCYLGQKLNKMVLCYKTNFCVLNLKNGKLRVIQKASKTRIFGLCFVPSLQLVILQSKKNINILSVNFNFKLIKKFNVDDNIASVEYCGGNDIVIGTSNGNLLLWDIKANTPKQTKNTKNAHNGLKFIRKFNKSSFLGCSKTMIKLWRNNLRGNCIWKIKLPNTIVNACYYSKTFKNRKKCTDDKKN